LTKLIINIYVPGEGPCCCIEVTVVAFKRKSKAKKCSDHHTISLITHTAKIVVRLLRRRRIERKIEDVLG
jgi:hypothetical protein